jgi:LysM repeat protein
MQATFPVSATFSGGSPLGSRAQSARPRFSRGLPVAAAPALFSVAAVVALVNAPLGLSAEPVPAHHAAPTANARPSGPVTALLASVTRPSGPATAWLRSVTRSAAKRNHAVPATYTVKPGDTLSAIAERLYSSPRSWPVLYWANHSRIHYADEIRIGQVLTVPAKSAAIPAPPSVLRPASPPAPALAHMSAPATTAASMQSEAPSPAERAQRAAGASTAGEVTPVLQSAQEQAPRTVSTTGDSSFQACVITRESGGDSQVMNASGHYGLYQFSASTWAEYGGSLSDFGHASVAQQDQVFDNAIAAGGQSNWSPYDGC